MGEPMPKVQFTLEQVRELAGKHKVVPIIETLFSTTETPLSIFEKLAAEKKGSFLLESAEQGVWARYSFVGVNNRGSLLQTDGGDVRWYSEGGLSPLPSQAETLLNSALGAVNQIQQAWTAEPLPGVPPLTSGLVGLLAWDVIREIEKLGPAPAKDFPSPTAAMVMFQDLVIMDHHTSSILLVSNIFMENGADLTAAYDDALVRIDLMRSDLFKPSQVLLADVDLTTKANTQNRVAKADFLMTVEQSKHFVRIGDVFQVVLSQRFDHELSASPLDVYRVLRALNPSPYMYLLNFEDESGDYSVVGSSPEALVTVNAKHAVMHPIAGSRPRGLGPEQDEEFAESLLADNKEKAEHLMLVDLARNDLLKVCEPSSVNVTEFMKIHRFSHIMHLVSTVEGEIRSGQTPVDVFKATFPAGTLSGAPKPRALEIIDELEVSNRGIFGGVVGYFDFAGNADIAIAIRTAFIRDGIAHVQAGAGIVLDSVPESEHAETIAKAGAPMRAVVAANHMVRRTGV
jgi:anthranilate synthase component 1